MKRRAGVFLSVLMFICGSCGDAVKRPDLPQSVSPGWQLQQVTEAPSHGEWVATYTGPGTARARLWAIHSSAEGLDRTQKWQPAANTVVFYSEHYFVALAWSGVDRTQAGALVHALERALGPPEQAR